MQIKPTGQRTPTLYNPRTVLRSTQQQQTIASTNCPKLVTSLANEVEFVCFGEASKA